MAGGERMAASCREKPRKYGSVVWLLDERFGCGGQCGCFAHSTEKGEEGLRVLTG